MGLRAEPVRVGVVFEKPGSSHAQPAGITSFRPVWFAAGSHKVQITDIHYSWTERKAEELFYKFTVSDGVNFYELSLNARKMQWEAAATD